MKPDESSQEFNIFEEVRLSLRHLLVREGRDAVEAERIAFYVVQGIRDVPKLLNALAKNNISDEKLREILNSLLDNASSLNKARALLTEDDDRTRSS